MGLAVSLDTERLIFALAAAAEAKDQFTERHPKRVANTSLRLGRRLGLQESDLVALYRGDLVHDIGKIGVPDAIPTTRSCAVSTRSRCSSCSAGWAASSLLGHPARSSGSTTLAQPLLQILAMDDAEDQYQVIIVQDFVHDSVVADAHSQEVVPGALDGLDELARWARILGQSVDNLLKALAFRLGSAFEGVCC